VRDGRRIAILMSGIVITGTGVVSPIGIGHDAYWQSMQARRSGVGKIRLFDARALPAPFGGQILDFDGKQYVRPRKSLKVMSREIQLAFAAADLATRDAGLPPGSVEPDRLGVVFAAEMMYGDLSELQDAYRACMTNGGFDFSMWGSRAMQQLFPLWMLKYLPNMAACHIAIAHDARGPCNSISLGEASSLLALIEGARIIERGAADVMIVGGMGSRLQPTALTFRGDCRLSHRRDAPSRACRPFDAQRDGMVLGEGAAAFVLESDDHAARRHATPWCRVAGDASTFGPVSDRQPLCEDATQRSLAAALKTAGLEPQHVGHVNANGLSTVAHDCAEAAAIAAVLPDVPVTAPKSYFGNLGAGTGAVEMVASLLALRTGRVPPTLNYEHPDPDCPVPVVCDRPHTAAQATALVCNQSTTGQIAAVVLDGRS